MSANVRPLDPASPEGMAAAERISDVFADIWLAILARRAAKAATPRVSASALSARSG